MAGCVPPPSFNIAHQPVDFLQTINENHPQRRFKRKRWNDGNDNGASPSKKFVSEEEVSHSIQQLNIANSNPLPTLNLTTPLTTAPQLNIKTVSSCQSSLHHKRGRKLSESSFDFPLDKRARLNAKNSKLTRSTVLSVGGRNRDKSKHSSVDHVISHLDHVTNNEAHVSPITRTHATHCTPTVLLQTSDFCPPIRGSQTPDIGNTPSPSTSLTNQYYTGGSTVEILNTQDYPVVHSSTPLQDDIDVLMSETETEKSLPDEDSDINCSSLCSRSSLSLSDVLKKTRGGVTLEDVSSSDSDGVGPERPLSLWIAPELQQTLANKNQPDSSLLPPSIVEKISKPRGMEVVLWVEPEKRMKADKIAKDDVADMSEQCTTTEEDVCLQTMENVGEPLDFDEDESDMESE